MPFTLVHPLAVIPLRRWGIFSALIAGSIVPDVARFTAKFGEEPVVHTWKAAFFLYLPTAMIFLYVFHALLKVPLIALAPARIQSALLRESPSFCFTTPSRFTAIVASILVGIATHFAWDSFTHKTGWPLQHYRLAEINFHLSPHYVISLPEILQDLSSISGAVLMLFLIASYAWKASAVSLVQEPSVPWKKILGFTKPAFVALILCVAAAPAMSLIALDPEHWLLHERRQFVGFSMVSAVDVLLLELLIFSAAWHWQNHRAAPPDKFAS